MRELERKKDYLTAELMEILAPSPDRIEPPCPVYSDCGGCDLQHAGPAAQLRLKKAILSETFQRGAAGIFSELQQAMADPLAAPGQFNYRQRIRLQVNRQGEFGFFRPESHVVVPVTACLLAGNELNMILKRLRASASFSGLLRHCRAFELLYNPEENHTILLLHYLRKPRPKDCQPGRFLCFKNN